MTTNCPILSAAALALTACFVPSNGAAQADTSVASAPTATFKIPRSALRQHKNWLEAPQTPGRWTLDLDAQSSSATFIAPSGNPRFRINCDLTSKQVTLVRVGVIAAVGTPMTIRTVAMSRQLAAHSPDRTVPETLAQLAASDQLLDALTSSKNRFAVELGVVPLYLPVSSEVTRIIEDCRRTS